jgi:hypothetical protein
MGLFGNTLGRVRVAAPCEADWNEMRGDERVRFCARCSLNVYNLSAMTRREAESLVVRSEGRLCVRFYRRKDGTIITRNCPVGLVALKRRASRVAAATFAAAVGFVSGVGVSREEQRPEAVAVPAPAEDVVNVQGFTMSEGSMSLVGEQYAAGVVLSGILFIIGYPWLKLRERAEARRREETHIWRR